MGRTGSLRVPTVGVTERRRDGSVSTDLGVALEVRQNVRQGLEQRWEFRDRPRGDGDLVLRVAAVGQVPRSATETGLHFVDPKSGYGTRYGLATWVDAGGRRTTVVPALEGAEIVLRVPQAVVDQSLFPAVLDPIISPEFGIDTPLPSPSAFTWQMRVARAGNTYLVVWTGSAWLPGRVVYGTRIDALTGALLDPLGFTIVEPGAAPYANAALFSVGTNGSEFAVIWAEARDPSFPSRMDVFARRVGTDGSVRDGGLSGGGVLLGRGGDSPAPEIIFAGTRYLAVWKTGTSTTGYEVVGARLHGTTLEPLDPQPTRTALSGSYATGLATDGVTALLVQGTEFTRIDMNDGTQLDMPSKTFAQDSGSEPESSAAFDGKNYLVMRSPNPGLGMYLSHITPDGEILEPPTSTTPGGIPLCPGSVFDFAPKILSDGRDTAVVANVRSGIIGARIDSDTGARLDGGSGCGLGLGLSLDSVSIDFAFGATLSDGELFVVSEGEGLLLDVAGMVPRGAPERVLGAPTSASPFDGAVASNGKDFLVAWVAGARPYSEDSVFAARVAEDGTLLDPDPIPLFNGRPARSVAVASAGDDYLVTWIDWSNYWPLPNGYYDVDRVCATRVRASDGAMLDGDPASCGVVLEGNFSGQNLTTVASDGRHYLVVWSPNYTAAGIKAVLLDSTAPSLVPDGGVRTLDLVTGGATVSSVAATPANALLAPSRFLVMIHAGGISTALLDTTTGELGPPVALTAPGVWAYGGRAVTDGDDFLVTWGEDWGRTLPGGGTLVEPMIARLRGSDMSVLPPGPFHPRTTHPLSSAALAYDGQHYWSTWVASDDKSFGNKLLATRLTSSGEFLDGPGATGAFLVANGERMGIPAIAANGSGRVLAVYTSLSHSPLATRLYARLLEDTASERDGGIVYRDASIPDVSRPGVGGGPGDGSPDEGSGFGGNANVDAAIESGGSANVDATIGSGGSANVDAANGSGGNANVGAATGSGGAGIPDASPSRDAGKSTDSGRGDATARPDASVGGAGGASSGTQGVGGGSAIGGSRAGSGGATRTGIGGGPSGTPVDSGFSLDGVTPRARDSGGCGCRAAPVEGRSALVGWILLLVPALRRRGSRSASGNSRYSRPMKRTIARLVETPLADRILRGDLEAGDTAVLEIRGGEIAVRVVRVGTETAAK